jgi:hypothetical protein
MFNPFQYFEKKKDCGDYLILCKRVQVDDARIKLLESKYSAYENYVLIFQNILLDLNKNKNNKLLLLTREWIIEINNSLEENYFFCKTNLEMYKNSWEYINVETDFVASVGIFDIKIRYKECMDKFYYFGQKMMPITLQLDKMAKEIADNNE